MLFDNDNLGYVGVVIMAFAGGMLLRDRAWRRQRKATRRAGVADPTAPASPHAAKPFASTIAERRGLALSAIYTEFNLEVLARRSVSQVSEAVQVSDIVPSAWSPPDAASFVANGLDRFAYLGPGLLSAQEVAGARLGLERYWGVVDSASCMKMLLDLLEDGARGQFDYWCSLLAQHQLLEGSASDIAALADKLAPKFPAIKKGEDSLSLLERLQLARDRRQYLEPAGTAAWDFARIVANVIDACQLGYLDNGQAWAIILAVEGKARRAFRSWEQVGESFLVGRHLHFGVRRADFDAVVQRLLTHPLSPWRSLPGE